MINKSSKIGVAFLLAVVMVISLSIGAFASNLPTTLPLHTNTNVEVNADAETQGIKKWITTTALKAAAKALRSGGKFIDNIASELGGKEATYFTKHTDTIADTLDDLVARGDVIEDAVIDAISTALISVGVPSGSARTIAAVFTFLVF